VASKTKDLTGQIFGRLTAVEPAGKASNNSTRWLCRCSCGGTSVVDGTKLRRGITKSCGCLRTERMTTHGLRNTRLYRIWRGIKGRTSIPSFTGYENYGGRGITMCEEWYEDFIVFYNWSMANGYTEQLTIDRKDVNGPYTAENCRWVTSKVQSNNRRNNRLFTYNGVTRTSAEWAQHLGGSNNLIISRLGRGWSVERALSTPVTQKYRKNK